MGSKGRGQSNSRTVVSQSSRAGGALLAFEIGRLPTARLRPMVISELGNQARYFWIMISSMSNPKNCRLPVAKNVGFPARTAGVLLTWNRRSRHSLKLKKSPILATFFSVHPRPPPSWLPGSARYLHRRLKRAASAPWRGMLASLNRCLRHRHHSRPQTM